MKDFGTRSTGAGIGIKNKTAWYSTSMDDAVFSKYVEAAIVSLPARFRKKLDNVVVTIEDYPNRFQQARVGSGLLLGLYEGVPRTKRGSGYGIGGTLPDKITIFKYPILAVSQTKNEVIEQIRSTVLHEIAHHFGMDEHAVRKAERERKKSY
jgi:predicted Zn-dependent protease with MMP-like domain